MIDIFRRLFGKTTQPATFQPPVAVVAKIEPATVPVPEIIEKPPEVWNPDKKFDHLYLKWMMSNHLGAASPYVEKTILSGLEKLRQSDLAASQLLPRVPTVLLQVLKSLRESNVSASDLAHQISKDVALVAELLHEVNGAYYSPINRVTSLDSAIQLLGFNGLRMLIARTAFRPIIQTQSGKLAKELAPVIWEHSEKSSLACQLLAQQRQLDSFQAFLAGLLQNVGLVIAFRLVDRTGVTEKLPMSAGFQTAFFKQAELLTLHVGEQWEFPEPVLRAIARKHGTTEQASELADCLQQADQLARLRLLVNHGVMTESDAAALLSASSGLLECFQQLNQAQA
ncbi:HDOD domain-containing protein [Undibacterium sp. Dicai25W]|uniref:HDOD domain-containing protein n=1 Tax=Undibacterium sp. Dicai25W TaxID=3413034 RepID=UPI003BEF80FD